MNALSILAIVGGVFVNLCLAMLCVAGLANANAQVEAQVKRALLAIAVVGVLSLGGAIWLMMTGRQGPAIAVALLPPVALVVFVFKMSEP